MKVPPRPLRLTAGEFEIDPFPKSLLPSKLSRATEKPPGKGGFVKVPPRPLRLTAGEFEIDPFPKSLLPSKLSRATEKPPGKGGFVKVPPGEFESPFWP